MGISRDSRYLAPLLIEFFVVIILTPNTAHAYEVDCSAGAQAPFVATQINGVFAEPRGVPPGQQGLPLRFHAGTDIGNQCIVGNSVYPIEGGVASTMTVTGCINNPVKVLCIRITNKASGRAFEYEHVDWTSVPGLHENSIVTISSSIGIIQPASQDGNHLHLNHVVLNPPGFAAPSYRVNPQFPLRLEFTDSDIPAFGTATVGAVMNRSLVLVQGDTGGGTDIPFRVRNGIQFISGDADIFVTASVMRGGNLYRKGLHMVKTNATPIVSASESFIGPGNQLMFDTLPDGPVSSEQVQRVYYQQQPDSITSIPTSLFLGPNFGNVNADVTLAGSWVTSELSDGPFSLCASIEGYPNGPTTTTNPCASVVIEWVIAPVSVPSLITSMSRLTLLSKISGRRKASGEREAISVSSTWTIDWPKHGLSAGLRKARFW